jgi:ATP-binding cassette subfamily B protein
MDSINRFDRNLTVLLIAHRLSTVKRCDTIVEIAQGRVKDQGPYEQLIERSASFRNMALHSVSSG